MRPSHISPPKTPLQERFEEVIDATGMSARGWSLKAGLSQSLVGQILRGELQGNSGRATFAALAEAAGVNVDWLADGVGPKSGTASEARLERTSRYSNLDRVLDYWTVKQPGRWIPAAIEAVRATANHEPEDLPLDAWETRLNAMNDLLRRGSALPDAAESDAPPRSKRQK